MEHIEQRVQFLQRLNAKYHPAVFQIRVPCFERDWRVPLKEELGIDRRLDATHYIEYRYDQFHDEISAAGLTVVKEQINWGEIWAVVKPNVNYS